MWIVGVLELLELTCLDYLRPVQAPGIAARIARVESSAPAAEGRCVFERERELRAARGRWDSGWYAPVFVAAFAGEWLFWRDSPFVSWGFVVLLALGVTVVSVPWIGSANHPGAGAALRQHGRWLWFALPALLLHGAAFAFVGPFRGTGPSTSGAGTGAIVYGMLFRDAMANHLVAAVRHESPRDLAFLLRLGADPGVPDAEGTYPIDEAADVERLRMLLARGARFSAGRGGHALYRAAERGDVALVREQLAAGADANAVIEGGWSALHAAAAADHADVIEALLAAGANADSRNDRGETPLDVANQSRSQDAAHLLATRVRPGHP